MLRPEKVAEVERLLASSQPGRPGWRLSDHKISRQTGVSRAIVAQIRHGKRPDYEARKKDAADNAYATGPIARCPGCRALVAMPCLLCAVRKLKQSERTA